MRSSTFINTCEDRFRSITGQKFLRKCAESYRIAAMYQLNCFYCRKVSKLQSAGANAKWTRELFSQLRRQSPALYRQRMIYNIYLEKSKRTNASSSPTSTTSLPVACSYWAISACRRWSRYYVKRWIVVEDSKVLISVESPSVHDTVHRPGAGQRAHQGTALVPWWRGPGQDCLTLTLVAVFTAPSTSTLQA
jgi:hypothetical protein